jgi:putative membrane protein
LRGRSDQEDRHKTRNVALMFLLCFAQPAVAQSAAEKAGVNSTLGIASKTQDFVTEAANSDMWEIASSKLVATKGDARHKAFADQMTTPRRRAS